MNAGEANLALLLEGEAHRSQAEAQPLRALSRVHGTVGEEPPEITELKAALAGGRTPDWLAERVPYLVGAREYSDYFGTRALEVSRYRRALAWSVGLNAVLGVALVAVTLLCRAVPYVVQTDKTGYQVAIGPAERVGPSDERVRIAASAKWIRALRTVVTDEAAQVEFRREVHAMLASGTAAKQKAVEWFDKQAGPGNSARSVAVEITRVAPREGGKLIEVEWLEHERIGSTPRAESQYAAIVTLSRSPLQRLDEIVANPLGLFVIDFAVSKLR